MTLGTILIVVCGSIILLVAFIGSLLPAIPGPPIAYTTLFLGFLHSEAKENISFYWLISLGIVMLIITILDFFLPVLTTKYFGGTKSGARGSNIGFIVGLILSFFTFAFSIVLGPLIGAYIGEVSSGQSTQTGLKSAWGSFLGFIGGTLIKVIYTVVVAVYFFSILL